jgi:hypothetical protein
LQERKIVNESLKRYIGCCGAYCKTCKSLIEGFCKGCKLGFDTGERNINRAKCEIKLCCIRDRKHGTCADCSELEFCNVIGEWYSKNGYKYKKYKEAVYFIRDNGYGHFFKIADKWKNAYGKIC